MKKTVTLSMLYDRLVSLEQKIAELEHLFLAEIEVSGKERRELKKAKEEIEKGEYISEGELFKLLESE